jgi:hypothetical protein
MALAGPFLGLVSVVAVFALCAHLLSKSARDQRSDASGQVSSETFGGNDPSDVSD